MPDDLRTRIAKVLFAMDCDDYDIQAGEELDPSVFWAIREGAERRADAVIAELGLREELVSGVPFNGVLQRRIISDWKTFNSSEGG